MVRKVIGTAIENGWELNKPGMTLALRLNHPTDDLAQPVYITWAVSRTASGRLSFRFVSCGTQGLVPLSGADLLEYLADPTVIYKTDEDIAEADAQRKQPPWDMGASPEKNLMTQLGATIITIEADRKPRAPTARPVAEVKPSPVSATPLRIQIPKA
jgi:hypothetical protein